MPLAFVEWYLLIVLILLIHFKFRNSCQKLLKENNEYILKCIKSKQHGYMLKINRRHFGVEWENSCWGFFFGCFCILFLFLSAEKGIQPIACKSIKVKLTISHMALFSNSWKCRDSFNLKVSPWKIRSSCEKPAGNLVSQLCLVVWPLPTTVWNDPREAFLYLPPPRRWLNERSCLISWYSRKGAEGPGS